MQHIQETKIAWFFIQTNIAPTKEAICDEAELPRWMRGMPRVSPTVAKEGIKWHANKAISDFSSKGEHLSIMKNASCYHSSFMNRMRILEWDSP